VDFDEKSGHKGMLPTRVGFRLFTRIYLQEYKNIYN